MKNLLTAALSILFVGSVAMASDSERKVESSKDVSKNPITGTVTTTQEYEKDVKMADGSKGQVKVKKKTKNYKDGSVKTSTETETESTVK